MDVAITTNAGAVVANLAARSAALRNLSPVLKDIAAEIDRVTAEAFEKSRRVDGLPFPDLATSTQVARLRRRKGAFNKASKLSRYADATRSSDRIVPLARSSATNRLPPPTTAPDQGETASRAIGAVASGAASTGTAATGAAGATATDAAPTRIVHVRECCSRLPAIAAFTNAVWSVTRNSSVRVAGVAASWRKS